MKNHLRIIFLVNRTLMKENRIDGPFAMCGRQIHEERYVSQRMSVPYRAFHVYALAEYHLSLDTGSDISCC